MAPSAGSTHLKKRDRVALWLRVAGTVFGFGVLGVALATSSWNSPWVIGLFVFIVVGGAIAYHLVTSVVRCPSCSRKVSSFGIADGDAGRKLFVCNGCGATSWLAEGFYWQRDF